MIILGVTGSIGSGKSFFCKAMLREKGVALFSSDAEVHKLYATNKTLLSEIAKHFPAAVVKGVISRPKLGEIVFKDAKKKKLLEGLVYPLLKSARVKFFKSCIKNRIKIAILEIPLLFENHLDGECDFTITLYSHHKTQAHRVHRRSGIERDKFDKIIQHQMKLAEKIKLSDFYFNTGQGRGTTARAAKKLYQMLCNSEL